MTIKAATQITPCLFSPACWNGRLTCFRDKLAAARARHQVHSGYYLFVDTGPFR
jgi:hypothetical protein